MSKPLLALSVGDPHGIGPEVILKAVRSAHVLEQCTPVVFAPVDVLQWHAHALGMEIPVTVIENIRQAAPGIAQVIPIEGTFRASDVGKATKESGNISVRSIQSAFQAVYAGDAQAMVTAPISKEAIGLAGSSFKGHTDMLAHLCGCEDDVVMMLTSDAMRVALVTVHISVAEVAPLITKEAVLRKLRGCFAALQNDFGIASPRIAVLGLNPHAGDGGVIGLEDRDVITPAMEEARSEGINAEGPFPADGYFGSYSTERHDLVLAMYHDQGLIAFKMQSQGLGINFTAGLPIIRTSPDHGTAYAIAGKGIASEKSFIAAMETAIAMSTVHHREGRT